MNEIVSPYRPGAGTEPPFFAGREQALDSTIGILERIERGGYERPRAITGMRGLGKTVLLRKACKAASNRGWRVVEVETRRRKPVDELLLAGLNRVVAEVDPAAAAAKRLINAVRSAATLSVRTQEPIELEWTLSAKERQGETGRDAGVEFVEVLRAVTQISVSNGNGLLLAIDELHESPTGQLESLMMALHTLQNESDLPLAVLTAGLPSLPEHLVDERTYAERLFVIEALGSLSSGEAKAAIQQPARAAGRSFDDDALAEIDDLTRGYPYFVQEWADHLWKYTNGDAITLQDVKRLEPMVNRHLDASFYEMRHRSLSPREREFVDAMAALPEDASIGQIAAHLNKATTDVSPVRQQLLDKGMVVPDGHGHLAFTLPGYRNYVSRHQGSKVAHGLRV